MKTTNAQIVIKLTDNNKKTTKKQKKSKKNKNKTKKPNINQGFI
jgi:hypothetical protein